MLSAAGAKHLLLQLFVARYREEAKAGPSLRARAARSAQDDNRVGL